MELTTEQALHLGIAAHNAGNHQEAKRIYQDILQSRPKHPDANHNLGHLALYANQIELSLQHFKTALDEKPNIEQFWASYVDALVKAKRLKDAKKAIKKAKKLGFDGKKLSTLLTQSKSVSDNKSPSKQQLSILLEHYQNGDYGDAERLSISITRQFPKNQFAWKVLSAVLKQTGRISEAIVPSQKAVELIPKDAEAHSNLGAALQELGKLTDAKASYTQAIALNPSFAEAHYNLGATLQELGRKEEAVASYHRAIALKPDYVEACNNLGNALQDLGRLDEASESYNQAIALKPDYAEAHNNLGNILKRSGRLEKARKSYNRAIELKPSYAQAHNNLGNTLQELGKLEEAESVYKKAIELKPNFAEAHNNLGILLQDIGRLDEAEASYTQAITLKPNFDEALALRGYLLLSKGRYEAALRDSDSCALSKKNKALPLISLYALKRTDEIHQRLEVQSKDDANNISLAAFAAFISEVEKRPTAYNFCLNPIDFIHVANLSSHVNNSPAYLRDIIEELNKTETIWEPSERTTVSGFQSPNNVNLFSNTTEKIAQLKSIIIREIEAYYCKFQNEQCSYIKNFPKTRNLFGWTVILKQTGHQRAHIHASGWLSGVIYLKVVPSLGRNEGAIEFSLNSTHYHDTNSSVLTHQPKAGDIVFFPSSLHHSTIPFTSDSDRVVVSFDLMPEGSDTKSFG